jgi:predicted secreted protein
MATVNLDTATRLDIVCRKGDSFLLELDFGKEMPASNTPVGLNGLYAFKVKASTTSDAAVTGGFAVNVTNSADGETNHVVRIEASSDDMTAFGSEPQTDVKAGLYVYDLQVTDRGSALVDPTYIYSQVDGADRTVTLLYGTFKIVDDVNA